MVVAAGSTTGKGIYYIPGGGANRTTGQGICLEGEPITIEQGRVYLEVEWERRINYCATPYGRAADRGIVDTNLPRMEECNYSCIPRAR
eukprot:7045002-Pyramimonas_sp.AAC.2